MSNRRLVRSVFLDESGNSGDLITTHKDFLRFGGQPIFTLAAVDTSKIDGLEEAISELKSKHRIQAKELKASSLYKSKPEFIFEIIRFLVENKLPFFVEVVDKKYYIATSIASHQIIPPYFIGSDPDGNQQTVRNLAADVMAKEMPDRFYDLFLKACFNPSESTIIASMKGLQTFFSSSTEYEQLAKNVEMSIEDYFDLKKQLGIDVVNKFIPIPDTNKRGKLVYLLPHVSSLTNIVARINLANKGNIKGVNFYHDAQNHFDEILLDIKEQMLICPVNGSKFITPHSDFNLKTSADLYFLDSKKELGIQIADLLAGFFSRYTADFFNKRVCIKDIYHQTYSKLCEGFNQAASVGVNWVIPASNLYELEFYHACGLRKKTTAEEVLMLLRVNYNG